MQVDISGFRNFAMRRDSGMSVDRYYTMDKSDSRCYLGYLGTHVAVMNAGRDWVTRYVVSGNGTGKTVMTCVEHVYHATGLYPDWWEGVRFRPREEVAGNKVVYSSVKTVLITQELKTIDNIILPLLLGEDYVVYNKNPVYAGGGLIKREWFPVDARGAPMIRKTSDGKSVDCIYVKHRDSVSQIMLRGASQGSKIDRIVVGELHIRRREDRGASKKRDDNADDPALPRWALVVHEH